MNKPTTPLYRLTIVKPVDLKSAVIHTEWMTLEERNKKFGILMDCLNGEKSFFTTDANGNMHIIPWDVLTRCGLSFQTNER